MMCALTARFHTSSASIPQPEQHLQRRQLRGRRRRGSGQPRERQHEQREHDAACDQRTRGLHDSDCRRRRMRSAIQQSASTRPVDTSERASTSSAMPGKSEPLATSMQHAQADQDAEQHRRIRRSLPDRGAAGRDRAPAARSLRKEMGGRSSDSSRFAKAARRACVVGEAGLRARLRSPRAIRHRQIRRAARRGCA